MIYNFFDEYDKISEIKKYSHYILKVFLFSFTIFLGLFYILYFIIKYEVSLIILIIPLIFIFIIDCTIIFKHYNELSIRNLFHIKNTINIIVTKIYKKEILIVKQLLKKYHMDINLKVSIPILCQYCTKFSKENETKIMSYENLISISISIIIASIIESKIDLFIMEILFIIFFTSLIFKYSWNKIKNFYYEITNKNKDYNNLQTILHEIYIESSNSNSIVKKIMNKFLNSVGE